MFDIKNGIVHDLTHEQNKLLFEACLKWRDGIFDETDDVALLSVIEEVTKKSVRKIHIHTGEEPPRIGDLVYVPPSDDSSGGLAEVNMVEDSMSAGVMVPFIRVKQVPTWYEWEHLQEQQEALSKHEPCWAKTNYYL